MNIELSNYNKHLVFEAKNQTGYSLLVGQTADHTQVNAIRPMELMLVILIIKFQLMLLEKKIKFHQSLKKLQILTVSMVK